MPSTRIETRTGWVGHRRQEVIEAVQNALLGELCSSQTSPLSRRIVQLSG